MAQAQYAGTGRRKNAVARVRVVPGTGKITDNKKDVEFLLSAEGKQLVVQTHIDGITDYLKDTAS